MMVCPYLPGHLEPSYPLNHCFKCLVPDKFCQDKLGGGLKYFLCSPLFGEDFQFD